MCQGANHLGLFQTQLSRECELSQIYTNHSIRITGATILSKSNFNPKQIMSVTSHKSVQSLTVYTKVSPTEKISMGQAVGLSLGVAPSAESSVVVPSNVTSDLGLLDLEPIPNFDLVDPDSDIGRFVAEPDAEMSIQTTATSDTVTVHTQCSKKTRMSPASTHGKPVFSNCTIHNINV